jgi:hypothetical protein
MTPGFLLERIGALQVEFTTAHQRVVAALESNDLRALVEASRDQGALCTKQGSLLAEYVAVAVTDRLDLSPAERDRVLELARQLRDEAESEARTKAAG